VLRLLQVAAATLKLALFVSSACSSLSYLLNGQLLLSFGLAFGIANLLTTPPGQWLMDAWIAKTGKPSRQAIADHGGGCGAECCVDSAAGGV
jgi:uncharacterized membrane protein YfcA